MLEEMRRFLRVSLGTKKANGNPFTLGSTAEEVIAAMGTPTAIYSYGSRDYEFSSVSFDREGKVDGWLDISDNLNIR